MISPLEKAMPSLQTMADEMERDRARLRVTDAMVRKARAGYGCGGRVLGYDNVEILDATENGPTWNAPSMPLKPQSRGGTCASRERVHTNREAPKQGAGTAGVARTTHQAHQRRATHQAHQRRATTVAGSAHWAAHVRARRANESV